MQRRIGSRLGRFLKLGRRFAYPLSLTRSPRTSAGRCVIVGNAAQGLHPVAGMGFNLGRRDVASLAELLAEQRRYGDAATTPAYDGWRAADRGESSPSLTAPSRPFSQSSGRGEAAANPACPPSISCCPQGSAVSLSTVPRAAF